MSTPAQIKLVQIARRQAGLDEPRYRLLLRNVAGVASCKDLNNASFEDVMAVLEDSGFADHKGETFWRDKVRQRACACGPRMARKIESMAAASRYPLSAMCRRMSRGRTELVGELEPKEAWDLIEAYKAAETREAHQTKNASRQGSRTQGSQTQGILFAGKDAPGQDAPAALRDGRTGTRYVCDYAPMTDEEIPF